MKRPAIVALAILSALAPAALAQEDVPQQHAQVVSKYDPYKDLSAIYVDFRLSTIAMQGGESVESVIGPSVLNVLTTCPGHDKCPSVTSRIFLFTLRATPNYWMFNGQSRDVDFLLDGQPISAGRYQWDGHVSGDGTYAESEAFVMSAQNFALLTHAQKATVRVGTVEFSFTHSDIALFKNLFDRAFNSSVPTPADPAKPKQNTHPDWLG